MSGVCNSEQVTDSAIVKRLRLQLARGVLERSRLAALHAVAHQTVLWRRDELREAIADARRPQPSPHTLVVSTSRRAR